MRIRQWLRDAWDNVSMPTEEKRGDDDSVKDLLRLKIKPGRSKFVYFMLLLCFIALGIRIGWTTDSGVVAESEIKLKNSETDYAFWTGK